MYVAPLHDRLSRDLGETRVFEFTGDFEYSVQFSQHSKFYSTSSEIYAWVESLLVITASNQWGFDCQKRLHIGDLRFIPNNVLSNLGASIWFENLWVSWVLKIQ